MECRECKEYGNWYLPPKDYPLLWDAICFWIAAFVIAVVSSKFVSWASFGGRPSFDFWGVTAIFWTAVVIAVIAALTGWFISFFYTRDYIKTNMIGSTRTLFFGPGGVFHCHQCHQHSWPPVLHQDGNQDGTASWSPVYGIEIALGGWFRKSRIIGKGKDYWEVFSWTTFRSDWNFGIRDNRGNEIRDLKPFPYRSTEETLLMVVSRYESIDQFLQDLRRAENDREELTKTLRSAKDAHDKLCEDLHGVKRTRDQLIEGILSVIRQTYADKITVGRSRHAHAQKLREVLGCLLEPSILGDDLAGHCQGRIAEIRSESDPKLARPEANTATRV